MTGTVYATILDAWDGLVLGVISCRARRGTISAIYILEWGIDTVVRSRDFREDFFLWASSAPKNDGGMPREMCLTIRLPHGSTPCPISWNLQPAQFIVFVSAPHISLYDLRT